MVAGRKLENLSLEELTRVVGMYPWFGGARLEVCRRMSSGGGWTREQFAKEALYLADRSKVYFLAKNAPEEIQSKEEVQTMIAPSRRVHVVGGDYFSQADYDQARQSGDSIPRPAPAAASPVISGSASPVISSEAERSPHHEVERSPRHEAPASDLANRFCTEALAEIFAEQGFTAEAKRIYSRLVLEFPEKSAYFAALIEKLEH